MAGSIELVEVGPRDGIQNEQKLFSVSEKVALIERLLGTGVRRLEIGSFVNPRRVPQMAGTEEVVALLPDRDDVVYIGLVLNQRGCERALATKIHEVGAVCVASDTFAMRNQGQSCDESVQVARDIVTMARQAGRSAQVTIGAAFGCPFEGEVPQERVIAMAQALAEADVREIALADTIGVAVPSDVEALVSRVATVIAPIPVRVHFHNTRNTGLANAWAAVGAGARIVDASLGGLGGCPFAPGAAGNVPTEDIVYMFERAGISTGLDLEKLIESSRWFGGVMGSALPAMVSKAGGFPSVIKEVCIP